MSDDPAADAFANLAGKCLGFFITLAIITAPVWVPYYCILLCLHYNSVNIEKLLQAYPGLPIGMIVGISIIQIIIYRMSPVVFKLIAFISIIVGLCLICNGYLDPPPWANSNPPLND